MTQTSSLDQKGSFLNYPFAELLVEISNAQFSGSMRIFRADQKAVIYFDEGNVVFAVSNSKALRLFNVMLQSKKIDKSALATYPNFANDMEFSLALQSSGAFAKEDVDAMFSLQIDAIIVDALSWPDGEWHFSPLARLRDDVRYKTNVHRVLMDYARCVPGEVVLKRFRSVNESFSMSSEGVNGHVLQAHEAYVLERFKGITLNIAQLRGASTLPESGMLQALYVLWLGGILVRRDWNAAFTPAKIGEILTAKITKVKAAEDIVQQAPEPNNVEAPVAEPETTPVLKVAEITLSLSEYLQRVEKAETHYDILGLSPGAELPEIKQMYFGLAKLFHPDKFHREKTAMQKRIQAAFTELAHAYETLKENEAREAYDFKIRKEIETREKRLREGGPDNDARLDNKKDSALQSFEKALIALKQEDYEQAVVLLGRAVHYSPENAQYHAYYGKALSAFEGQDHKAESEFNAAVKLAPNDTKIRMMLVDFLLEIDMKKRAIGELNRLLAIAPDNKDALKKLARLQK